MNQLSGGRAGAGREGPLPTLVKGGAGFPSYPVLTTWFFPPKGGEPWDGDRREQIDTRLSKHYLPSYFYMVGNKGTSLTFRFRFRFQSGEVKEWFERAMRFHEFYREMALMVDKFVNIPNRVLLYQLYNYVSDMRSVMSMVNSHIKWHGEMFTLTILRLRWVECHVSVNGA